MTEILLTGTLSRNSVTQISLYIGAQRFSGRVLDSRAKGCGFEPHRCHCVVSLSKNINPSLVLVQPRKTLPYITERLLMGHKESNQTKQSVYLALITNTLCTKRKKEKCSKV